ncbi:MAG: MBL fold metallo-hydrolase RNA specificity domain-containing protein [Fibrobacterota bacterium]|nr:MBL fold metallo-hydrolase [Chitinispirillaceae bacterium]
MSEIKLTFYGAAETVTGSCTLVECGPTRLLIDYGLIQGTDNDNAENIRSLPFLMSELDAVILTHGHMDHTGRVPLLPGAGFKGKIITHAASADLATLIWFDSIKIHDSGEPLYDEKAVNDTLGLVQGINYNQEIEINDVKITLFDAGHILGSSHVLLNHKGKRIIFSGDIGVKRTPIIRDPFTQWERNVHAVVIESTYGNRLHKNREKTVEEFRGIVDSAIKEKGIIIIPAFAIGRTQELLYHLNNLVETKKVKPLPVFVDSPMANRVTQIYKKYTDCYDGPTSAQILSGDLPLEFKGLNHVISSSDSRSIRETIPPFIVIAGSGMCNGGRVLHHLRNHIDQDNTVVMFVGYQGEGTLGRRLIEGEKSVFIGTEMREVKASIATLNGFSAHADQAELLEWAKAIPGKSIRWFVNHGEKSAAQGLCDVILKEGLGESVVVKKGMSVIV